MGNILDNSDLTTIAYNALVPTGNALSSDIKRPQNTLPWEPT